MAKLVKLSSLGSELNKALAKHKEKTNADINKAIRVATISVWGNILRLTPVDTGRARSNWFVGMSVGNMTSDRTNDKGAGYIAKELPKNLLNKKVFLYNNLPYIEKLEFGGYGSNDTEKTNTQGFSKLAPKGMVRVSLLNWGSTLRKAFEAIKWLIKKYMKH